VAEWQRSLSLEGRAVPQQNFHVTLAFLGMQEAESIPLISEVASGLQFPRCEVALDKSGTFRKAGVLWLGANEIPEALNRFQHDLVGGLLKAGIGYDRKPWIFHLTLYRKMRKRPVIMHPVNIRWPMDGFSLIESVSVRSGVEYRTIGHWKAAG
jgi:2'-5' RNA ligase